MSQMLFSHDTEITLRAACGLINTDRMDVEQLGDAAALEAFLDGWGYTGRRDHDTAELASIHRLRERLAKIWQVADDEVQTVAQVNALLSDTKASPWLTRHPEQPEWHLHLASVHDPLWQRMGAEFAMALADLIRIGQADGTIPSTVDADATALTFLCLTKGLRVIGRTGRGEKEMMATVEAAMRLVT